MAKAKKVWVYSPPKPPKPKLPLELKAELELKASDLLPLLKARFIKPPPAGWQYNYLTDIWTKTYRHYFYFCGTYTCPPDARVTEFEVQFARMEYAGEDKFHLSYMRHTGQWWPLFQNLNLDASLIKIQETPHFFPV